MSIKIELEPRDHMAFFDLTVELLGMLLQFPEGTKIERMHISNTAHDAISIVVTHPDLPQVYWGEWIPRITPLVSEADGRLVVHPWNKAMMDMMPGGQGVVNDDKAGESDAT